jgi:acetolactate synthase-1/2/3 large subunit
LLLTRRNQLCRVDRADWDRRCAEWKTKYPVVTEKHRTSTGLVSVYLLAEVLWQETSAADVMVSGNSGSAIEIFLLATPTRTGQRIFHTAGLGAMGYGIPSSIGACLASGRRRTICVDGDGGFMFNIQDLETISRLRLPITFFILNNDGYSSIRASQTNYFGRPLIGADAETGLTVPDLSRVAEAFGIRSAVIHDQSNLVSDVRRVLEMPGPVVCDVRVIPDESREPRLSSAQRPDGTFVSKPLEDLWPFLDRDEFLANMLVEPLPE